MANPKPGMNEFVFKPWSCSGCKTIYDPVFPICPKCGKSIPYVFPKETMDEIMEFLKSDKLNYIKMYFFGDVLCYDLVKFKKPAKKRAAKKKAPAAKKK